MGSKSDSPSSPRRLPFVVALRGRKSKTRRCVSVLAPLDVPTSAQSVQHPFCGRLETHQRNRRGDKTQFLCSPRTSLLTALLVSMGATGLPRPLPSPVPLPFPSRRWPQVLDPASPAVPGWGDGRCGTLERDCLAFRVDLEVATQGLSVGGGVGLPVFGKKALLRTGKVPLWDLYFKGSLSVRVERRDDFPFVDMVSCLLDPHV